MKLIKITTIALLILSQNSFATGSDGGNSNPEAQPPSIQLKSNGTMQLCLTDSQSGEQHCMLVNSEENSETEL